MSFALGIGGVLVVIDTSIWVDAHRTPAGPIAATLNALLDADEVVLALPVRLELLAGASRRDRSALRRALAALPVLRPSEETWNLIERWVPIAADTGWRVGIADWLIAALSHEIGALVWSLDDDFAVLERLTMIQRYSG